MKVSCCNFLSPTFTSINLDEKEKIRAEKVLNSLKTETDTNKLSKLKTYLFEVLDPHIKKEVNNKTLRIHDRENFLQKTYLTLFELLESLKGNKNALSTIIQN